MLAPQLCALARADGPVRSALGSRPVGAGNYLLGAKGEEERWAPLEALWDEKWFIRCADAEAQRQRLIRRHHETWNEEKAARWGAGLEGAAVRADSNDVLNMGLIGAMEAKAERVIVSV